MRFRAICLLVLALVVSACSTSTVPLSELGWSRVPHSTALGGEGEQGMSDVAVGGPGLVAVGTSWFNDNTDAAVWTSPDGFTWSRVPHSTALGNEGRQVMTSVTAGGPGLVAVGTSGDKDSADAAVWTSPDGITWNRVPHSTALGGEGSQIMSDVAVGGPGLVAVGTSGDMDSADAAVWTSPDGITWNRVPHSTALGGEGSQVMASVTVGGPGFVAVGDSWTEDEKRAAVWTSPDGATWNRIPDDDTVFGGERTWSMESVAVGGPGLVAVGYAGSGGIFFAVVWTSPDGIAWSRVPHDGNVFGDKGQRIMNCVTAGRSGLVAVGYSWSTGGEDDAAVLASPEGNATVWTSPDGITWTRIPNDEVVFGGERLLLMSGVTFGGPGLVAVGGSWSDDRNAAVWVAAEAD